MPGVRETGGRGARYGVRDAVLLRGGYGPGPHHAGRAVGGP
ncbi:hypothetical protein ACFV6M_26990 [Streptomyces californicus]|nr:hypothetical protein [Streptomyces californicus]